MDTSAVFQRTTRGQADFSSGSNTLSNAQRTVLVLVDGKRNAREINRVVQALCDGYATLGQLTDLGLINISAEPLMAAVTTPLAEAPAKVSDAALAEAKRYASKSLSDQLGPVSNRVCLKIENSKSTRELMEAITQAHRMMSEFAGASRANAFEKHLNFLLRSDAALLTA